MSGPRLGRRALIGGMALAPTAALSLAPAPPDAIADDPELRRRCAALSRTMDLNDAADAGDWPAGFTEAEREAWLTELGYAYQKHLLALAGLPCRSLDDIARKARLVARIMDGLQAQELRAEREEMDLARSLAADVLALRQGGCQVAYPSRVAPADAPGACAGAPA